MNTPIEAIILAAGRGSRLNKMTDTKPKCLTEIEGKTLLAWQISALKAAGIEKVTIIRGYLKETLTPETIGTEFSVLDNDHWSETNMVSTLTCAHETLSTKTCIISYSDIIYSPTHITKLLKNRENIAMSYDTDWEDLWRLRMEKPLTDAETFIQTGGILQEIGKKTNDITKVQGQYMGLLKTTPTGWKLIQKHLNTLDEMVQNKLDMTSLLSQLLEKNTKIGTTEVSGKWLEVDTVDDLNAYIARLKKPDWHHDWR